MRSTALRSMKYVNHDVRVSLLERTGVWMQEGILYGEQAFVRSNMR